MYHSVGSASKRILTIQFPELQVLVNFDNPVKDNDGYTYPSITVFSKFDQDELQEYIDSFFAMSSLDEIFSAIFVDNWTDEEWLEHSTKADILRGRSFVTTFVNLASLDQR